MNTTHLLFLFARSNTFVLFQAFLFKFFGFCFLTPLVVSTSLQEFTKNEINATDERVLQRLNEEKRRREHVLEMRHSVAKEVTKKSKESLEGRLLITGRRNRVSQWSAEF